MCFSTHSPPALQVDQRLLKKVLWASCRASLQPNKPWQCPIQELNLQDTIFTDSAAQLLEVIPSMPHLRHLYVNHSCGSVMFSIQDMERAAVRAEAKQYCCLLC